MFVAALCVRRSKRADVTKLHWHRSRPAGPLQFDLLAVVGNGSFSGISLISG